MENPRPEELIDRLNRDAVVIATRFVLRYRAIEAERPRVKRRYGVCYADGTIRIRLRHAATDKPLKYSSLVNTLCHELAHLQHFNHGARFQRLYRAIFIMNNVVNGASVAADCALVDNAIYKLAVNDFA